MDGYLEYDLSDVIIGRPYTFRVGRKQFSLYPVTLAKMYLLKRQVEELSINQTTLILNPYLEALRLVKSNREVCCSILAYHTAPNDKKSLFDQRSITIRKNYFINELEDGDLASMMILVLTADKTDKFVKHFGMDVEKERMLKVLAVKNKHNKNTMTFNGRTIFGTFIAQLKEMGYSDDEILYERGYTYLQLMLQDKVVTLHLSDEEMRDIPTTDGGQMLDANNPDSAKKIIDMFANRGVK